MHLTSCTHCIFAETIDLEVLPPIPIQTGCTLGRLDKFLERGAIVDSVKGKTGHFFAIDRECNAKLKEGVPISREEAVRRIDEHVGIRVGAIIIADGLTSGAMPGIETSLRSLEQQVRRPDLVTILVDDADLADELVATLEAYSLRWEVTLLEPLEPEQLAIYPSLYLRAIDDTVRHFSRLNLNWVAVLLDGDRLDPTTLLRLNREINYELRPWVAVMADADYMDARFISIPYFLNPAIEGNAQRTIEEKINDLRQEHPDRVATLGALC